MFFVGGCVLGNKIIDHHHLSYRALLHGHKKSGWKKFNSASTPSNTPKEIIINSFKTY